MMLLFEYGMSGDDYRVARLPAAGPHAEHSYNP
jgi:hypothetical protein